MEPMDGDDELTSGAPRRRPLEPWAIAAFYALLAVLLAAVGFGSLWRDLSVLPDRPITAWCALLTAFPAAALVLLRRRAPWVGFALAVPLFVADMLTVGGLVPLLVVLEMLHSGLVRVNARQRRTVLVWGIAVLAALTLVLQALLGDPRLTVLVGLQLGALFGMTYWYANSVAQSRELVALYRQRAEDLERLTELDRIAAVQDERERMASELHDIVAGHVSAVAIRSEAALMAHADPDPPGADAAGSDAAGSDPEASGPGAAGPERLALRAVRDSSLQAHAALRSLIAVLRDSSVPTAAPAGRAQLPELVSEARRSGLRVELRDTWVGELPAAVDRAVGQIVQEGLANSAKHEAGGTVEVRVEARGSEVFVRVVSGGGRSLAQPELRGSGLGLRTLEARVRALGGTFAAGPDGDRWSVAAQLPATPERAS